MFISRYMGHEDSQLLARVSCALLHSATSVSQKQYQLLALKWRLYHMPADHLVLPWELTLLESR